MGQFSWISVDTEVPIYNDKPAGTQTVTMVYKDEEGNIQRVVENDYEGYGVFGGIDFYDAMAWMNGLEITEDDNELRSVAISFYFDVERVGGTFPQLFLSEPPSDEDIDFTIEPIDDPNQGWSHREADYDYDEFSTYYGDDDDDYDADDDYYDDDEDEDYDDEEDDDDDDY